MPNPVATHADSKLPRSELLCGALALLALVGTWGHLADYMALGFPASNQKMLSDMLANAASRSFTIDLFAVALPVVYWMLAEARRLTMPGIWLYIFVGVFVAISVSLPVFLIHRGRVLRSRGEAGGTGLDTGGKVCVALMSLITIAYVVASFTVRV